MTIGKAKTQGLPRTKGPGHGGNRDMGSNVGTPAARPGTLQSTSLGLSFLIRKMEVMKATWPGAHVSVRQETGTRGHGRRNLGLGTALSCGQVGCEEPGERHRGGEWGVPMTIPRAKWHRGAEGPESQREGRRGEGRRGAADEDRI